MIRTKLAAALVLATALTVPGAAHAGVVTFASATIDWSGLTIVASTSSISTPPRWFFDRDHGSS